MAEMWKPASKETIEHWIKTIEDEASDQLNSWEINFIESIKGKYPLSSRQQDKLEEIYANKTN